MSPRRPTILAALWLAMPLAPGCAPLGFEPGIGAEESAPSGSESPRPDFAGIRLTEAAERAEAALTALAMMRAVDRPPLVPDVPTEVPAALRRRVTVDWIGPVEPLAEALAERAGYRFVVGGAAPARPVMVSVSARDVPLIEVLRDVGLQVGDAATLVVDANRRTIRLDWRREHAGPGDSSGTAPGREGS